MIFKLIFSNAYITTSALIEKKGNLKCQERKFESRNRRKLSSNQNLEG